MNKHKVLKFLFFIIGIFCVCAGLLTKTVPQVYLIVGLILIMLCFPATKKMSSQELKRNKTFYGWVKIGLTVACMFVAVISVKGIIDVKAFKVATVIYFLAYTTLTLMEFGVFRTSTEEVGDKVEGKENGKES